MALLRAAATVGGYTMASRVLGFVRDLVFAALLGAGPVADAFLVAFRLPNLFRRLFAEGAFAAAFVPMFSGRLQRDGRKAALAFGEEVLAVLFAALLVFTALAEAFMPIPGRGVGAGLPRPAGALRTRRAVLSGSPSPICCAWRCWPSSPAS